MTKHLSKWPSENKTSVSSLHSVHSVYLLKYLRVALSYIICHYSNSLIMHQVQTKKITTVKEVRIPGLNWHRCWRFYFSVYSFVCVSIENIYQTLETVFHRLSKHLEFLNSLLGVWISRWNTVSRVWYITSCYRHYSVFILKKSIYS